MVGAVIAEPLVVDGVTFANISGAQLERGLGESATPVHKVPEIQPASLHGTFEWNNGMLTVIDHAGQTYVSVNMKGLTEALERQGFKHKAMHVYCSNGEHPVSGQVYGDFTRNYRATTGKSPLEALKGRQ